jgi:hypothetical protein
VGLYTHRFKQEDLQKISRCHLDFGLRFAFNILRGDILTTPRFGIWSYHHDDPEKYRGTPPGFWEIFEKDPVSGAVLQRLTEKLDGGVILKKGFFQTLHSSYVASRDQVLFESAGWAARVCRDVVSGNADYLAAPPVTTGARIYRTPSNGQMIRFFFRWLKAVAREQFASLFRTRQWTVGLMPQVNLQIPPSSGPVTSERISGVVWMPERRGLFLADPFAAKVDDDGQGLEILAENFAWKSLKGHVSSVTYRHGRFGPITDAIREPFHMSYPFVFEWEGEAYCMPETSAAGGLKLYKRDKSGKWEDLGLILDGFPALDPTLLQFEDRWWLFCGHETELPNGRLYAWHSLSPLGPWKPHSSFPLKEDIRNSRPAGTPFAVNGRVFRPAQDCSTGYGAAVSINEIQELTPTSFEERIICRLVPDPSGPYPDGLHTLNRAGDWIVLDGARKTFVAAELLQALKRKAGRLLPRRT